MTIADSLRSISLYPVNQLTIENITEECGLLASTTLSEAVRKTSAFKRAKAMVYQYLSEAPDVTEANVHFSFTDEDRKRFRSKAAEILSGIGDEGAEIEVGWIGEDF